MMVILLSMGISFAQDASEVGVWVESDWPEAAEATLEVQAPNEADFGTWTDASPFTTIVPRVVKGTGFRLSAEMAATTTPVHQNQDVVRALDASKVDVTSPDATADSLVAAVAAADPVWPLRKVEAGDYVVLVAQGDKPALFDHRLALAPAKGNQHELLMRVMEALAPHFDGVALVNDETYSMHACAHDGGELTAREHVVSILQACLPAPAIPYYALRTSGPDWVLNVSATSEGNVGLRKNY